MNVINFKNLIIKKRFLFNFGFNKRISIISNKVEDYRKAYKN